jgi:putative ABC transport system substrate-binding protein
MPCLFVSLIRLPRALVGRILNRDKSGDLSVMRSTKFEFIINLKTAKAWGLTIPLVLLAAQVIE